MQLPWLQLQQLRLEGAAAAKKVGAEMQSFDGYVVVAAADEETC